MTAGFATSVERQNILHTETRESFSGRTIFDSNTGAWPERLSFVFRCGLFRLCTSGWEGRENGPAGLAGEVVWLARVLVHLLPDDPEAPGLPALVLHCQARDAAGLVDGRYIPLPEQETARWDADVIEQAEVVLRPLIGRGIHPQSGNFEL